MFFFYSRRLSFSLHFPCPFSPLSIVSSYSLFFPLSFYCFVSFLKSSIFLFLLFSFLTRSLPRSPYLFLFISMVFYMSPAFPYGSYLYSLLLTGLLLSICILFLSHFSLIFSSFSLFSPLFSYMLSLSFISPLFPLNVPYYEILLAIFSFPIRIVLYTLLSFFYFLRGLFFLVSPLTSFSLLPFSATLPSRHIFSTFIVFYISRSSCFLLHFSLVSALFSL